MSEFFVMGVRLDSPNCDPISHQTIHFPVPIFRPAGFKSISVKFIPVQFFQTKMFKMGVNVNLNGILRGLKKR